MVNYIECKVWSHTQKKKAEDLDVENLGKVPGEDLYLIIYCAITESIGIYSTRDYVTAERLKLSKGVASFTSYGFFIVPQTMLCC